MIENDIPPLDEMVSEEIPPGGPGIGTLLRHSREAQGLSYADVSEKTRLRPYFIQSLEQEQWDRLPSPAFVPGFIRTYARALGLEEDKILGLYREAVPSDSVPFKSLAVTPGKKKAPWIIALCVVAVLAAALYGWRLYGPGGGAPPGEVAPAPETAVPGIFPPEDRGETPAPAPGPTPDTAPEPVAPAAGTEPAPSLPDKDTAHIPAAGEDTAPPPAVEPDTVEAAATESAPEPGVSESPDDTAPPPESPREDTAPAPGEETLPLTLKAHIIERTWIKVYVDDRAPKEYIFAPGKHPEWNAKDGFEMVIGNAGGIELEFNGMTIGPLGDPGQVVRVRFPEHYERRSVQE